MSEKEGEPVAWQYRIWQSGDWSGWMATGRGFHDAIAKDKSDGKRTDYDIRALYAIPDAAQERIRELEATLTEISECKGRFSNDPLTHACNTIEDMKDLAKTALSTARPIPEKEDGK